MLPESVEFWSPIVALAASKEPITVVLPTKLVEPVMLVEPDIIAGPIIFKLPLPLILPLTPKLPHLIVTGKQALQA